MEVEKIVKNSQYFFKSKPNIKIEKNELNDVVEYSIFLNDNCLVIKRKKDIANLKEMIKFIEDQKLMKAIKV